MTPPTLLLGPLRPTKTTLLELTFEVCHPHV
jgi:hypothetical protein